MCHSPHESLREFPHVVSLPVIWGDLDAFGHVNNLIYLRWAETARIYYLEGIGFWKLKDETNIGPILAHIGCNYRRPVNFPDTVHVGTRVTRVGNSSFRMEHRIVSENMGVVVADVDSTLVVYDYNANQPVPMPDEVRRAIRVREASGAAEPAPTQ